MRPARALLFVSATLAAAACGARTGLLVPLPQEAGVDAADDVADGGSEPDAAEEPDVTEEPDATDGDAPEEDALQFPDAPNACPDGGSTLIYVITEQNVLMGFYPPTASFTTIGTIRCPAGPGDMPFSMAVDRAGVAYVVFSSSVLNSPTNGRIYRVSTLNAACQATTFVPGTFGFPQLFGMGYSANDPDAGDAGETLYLAGDRNSNQGGPAPARLAALDTKTFSLQPVGLVTPTISEAELTGTGAAQLFAFYPASGGIGGTAAIGQIDKATAALLSSVTLPQIDIANGWAFAFWGGDFYTFTAPDGADTIVQRYRPSDGTVVQVATTPGLVVVGAGVSTCAPQM